MFCAESEANDKNDKQNTDYTQVDIHFVEWFLKS